VNGGDRLGVNREEKKKFITFPLKPKKATRTSRLLLKMN